MDQATEAYSEYCQTSVMERLAKIVHSFYATLPLRCLTGF